MAPTTRGGPKPSKTTTKKTPTKDVAKKSSKATGKLSSTAVSKKTKAKKSATTKPTANVAAKKSMKKATKGTTTKSTTQTGVIDSPVMNYCEEDRRIHGTYKRCGAGALFIAHKPPSNDATSAPISAAMSKKGSSKRITKKPQAQKSDLDYDAVVRNGAKMILNGLEDLWERINKEPMASEKSLQGVVKHMGEARDAIQTFLESGRKYSNPHPEINFRREFEEGDGIGNWIAFKPAWFEGGRFELGDIMTFQSALQGLKAEGEVVTMHR